MVEHKDLINDIKLSLFDFIEYLNELNNQNKNIFKDFSKVIASTFEASSAELVFNHGQLEQQIMFDVAHHPVSYLNDFYNKQLMFHFKEGLNVAIVNRDVINSNMADHNYFIIMKMHYHEALKGFIYIAYDEEKPEISLETLTEVQRAIEKCFTAVYSKFQQRFVHERNRLLFQLSTILHSVHDTAEVLKNVYKTIQEIYPNLTFRFLMSQEYDEPTIPIQLIDYTGESAESMGTISYINNEIQLEHDWRIKKTIIYSPLNGNQGVYGVLEIIIPELMNPSERELKFISETTNMIGRAVERTTLYQSSNQLVTDLQFINIASRDLNSNLEKNEISENIKKHISTSCNSDHVGIIISNEASENARYVVSNVSSSFFQTLIGAQFIEHVYERLNENPEPILSGNYTVEEMDLPFHSVMIVPMWDSERIFGIIIVLHESPYYFSFDKYKFVQSFVQHASLAYTNSMLKEQLRKTAITDHLTQLYLRNHLNTKIKEHRLNDGSGSLILFDIDDFKLINDTYGHTIGDQVLMQVADVIRSNIRKTDIASRWGGEEFAVYVPHCNLETAIKKAEKIRQDAFEKTDPKISISVGVSAWNNANETIEQLFMRADEALYEAKAKGKNCIISK